MTNNHDALDLTVKRPPPSDMGTPLALPTQDIRPGTPLPWTSKLGPLLVKTGGNHWRPVQTCYARTPSPGATSGGGY